ncbi:MAG TPA: glycosyltransferase family 1 protein [Solirubrobacteraceae bacterium]|nr:glycosyltransferase family 1 protein [Solirubrobacteraceae bacterium]
MRVLIDTTFASRAPQSGTGVYLERLCSALAGLGGIEVVPTRNERRRPPADGGWGSARNLLSDERWTQVELPRRARAAGAEVIHHPLPAFAHASRLPQVVTVHDLAFEALPEHFDPGFRRFARLTHRAAARRARAVICVSQATAADVRARWGIAAERIVVAPHGPGQEFGPSPRAAPDPPDAGYFLYVGDGEPRKNLAGLLAAYRVYRERAAAPLDLVLAGSARAAEAGVRIEPGPDAARLGTLYVGAVALVHSALHEGFGMTLLEAMAAGAPVLAAPAPAAVEVCGDAARYADPRDPSAFAAAMAEIVADAALRRELVERGRRRAARFSWTDSARIHVGAYSLALR